MIESRTRFIIAPRGTRAADLGRRTWHSDEAEADTIAASLDEAVFIVTITVEPKES